MTENSFEILLVEDNPDDEALTLYALKHHFANNTQVVRDGAEALDFVLCTGAFADRPVAHLRVIVVDKKLALVDGMEVVRLLRADPSTSLIPIVMFTSSSDERDMIESYRLGVNSYIVKPVEFEKFAETVRQMGHYWLHVNHRPPDLNQRVADLELQEAPRGGKTNWP